MSDVKDYSNVSENGNSHYNGVPSMYGRLVSEQNKMQPKYSEPGNSGGGQAGAHRNVQKGP